MKNFIFIDDEREVSDVTWLSDEYHYFANSKNVKVTIIRNFDQFYDWLEENIECQQDIDNLYISFDHDLNNFIDINNANNLHQKYGFINKYGENPNSYELTGMSCLKFMVDYIQELGGSLPDEKSIVFHTKNHIAKEQMLNFWLNS